MWELWLDRGGGSSERVSGTSGRGTRSCGKWGPGEDSRTWRSLLRGCRDGCTVGWSGGRRNDEKQLGEK